MDESGSEADKNRRKDLLTSIGRDAKNSVSHEDNRRGVLKGIAVSVLSTLGLASATNTAAATHGESVTVSEEKARRTIAAQREKLAHLAEHGVIHEVDVEEIVNKAKNGSSEDEVQVEVIQGPRGELQSALSVTTEGVKGKVTMGFPLNSDFALFDLPDSVDSKAISDSWNDEVSVSSCHDANDSCCCNVSSCDYCYCDYGYCDCTSVAGTQCWYEYCDCCCDYLGYCTWCCTTSLEYNC